MHSDCVLLSLFPGQWGEAQSMVSAFWHSPYAAMLKDALCGLNRDVLYMSHVHGIGHIERTMLHGAMCAWAEGLSEADTRLLLMMCSYHDTGRSCDFLDGAHGLRSAEKLPALVCLSDEDRKEAQVGIEAHSVGDRFYPAVLEKYAPANRERTAMLAQMLKDSDGLDRVRIHDLDPAFLRRKPSAARADFAQQLFDRYDAVERENNLKQGLEGFDLSTIQATKAFVQACYDRGLSCAEAALETLFHIYGIPASGEAVSVPGGECGLLSGALVFLRQHFSHPGYDTAAQDSLAAEFRRRFQTQYGSSDCEDIKPHVSCRGFTVDAVLFAVQFIEEKKK